MSKNIQSESLLTEYSNGSRVCLNTNSSLPKHRRNGNMHEQLVCQKCYEFLRNKGKSTKLKIVGAPLKKRTSKSLIFGHK